MEKTIYSDEMKVEDALQKYFAKYHFSNGGYTDKYFKIKLGPIYIPVPNTKARIDAVKFHDIHHILTGYNANWKGETEIGAWEIASGCGKHYAAWILNFGSFMVGTILFPKAIADAFLNGRKAKPNLYHNYIYDNTLLNKSVGELKNELGIHYYTKNKASDYFFFLVWVLFALFILVGIILLFCSLI